MESLVTRENRKGMLGFRGREGMAASCLNPCLERTEVSWEIRGAFVQCFIKVVTEGSFIFYYNLYALVKACGRGRWRISVIPALRETEAGRSLRVLG